ncbi:hypothetical protein [Anaerotignum sp.]|uniref:cucumopine synthase-related protein n=1 Tax=Anaerotignum sp. TaxID=2039241 RepID=UPI003736A989
MTELQREIEKHIDEIWVDEPLDITLLKNGYVRSGAGIKEQYFTTLVMLSGEVRALGIHIFPDLLHHAKKETFSLSQLSDMTKRALEIDLGVIGYFGLETLGGLLKKYYEALPFMQNKEEYVKLTKEMFTMTNRYQLWMHQIFPWKLSIFFPKADTQRLQEFLKLV